jgi:hypothetical protein
MSDRQLEKQLLPCFGTHWHRDGNVVLFVETHNDMLEMGENVLLLHDDLSPPSLWVPLEGIADIGTDDSILIAID